MISPLASRRRPLRVVAALAAAAALVLSGCTSDPLAEQYRSGSGQGYISGDGRAPKHPELLPYEGPRT